MPRISIGIDQSYSGCAIVTYNASTHDATRTVCDFSPKAAGTGIDRLLYVYDVLEHHLRRIEKLGRIGHICYEGYAYGARFRREELGELGGMMKLALGSVFHEHIERRLHAVAPATVKKFVTGSGRADKDKMMMAVFKRWGFEPDTHDVADAYVLARIADALAEPEPPELQFQKEVLDTIRRPPAKAKKTAA